MDRNMRGAKAMNTGKRKARTQMQAEVIKYSMKPYLSSHSKDVESESEQVLMAGPQELFVIISDLESSSLE